MAKLKDIKGSAIQYLAEDPVQYVGSWASGGSLNTGRGLMGNGMGTQTAAAVVAGFNPPSTYYANTELYNGTSWTESGDLPSARYQGMAGGTQTAGIYAGGYSGSWPALGDTYYFNGTAWSDQSSSLNTPRDSLRGTGIQTAALACGGISGPGQPADDETEIWNGSTWTEVNNLNTARYSFNVAGTSTDAIAGPGTAPPGYAAAVETWNGSSWTETTEINTARNNYGRTNYAAGGASTGALIFGGQSQPTGSPDSMAQTEQWNGSAWTEIADLGTGRSRVAGAGTTTAALAVGSYPNTNNSATEEFSFPGPTSTVLQEGQLWFNSTSSALKGYGTAAGIPAATWSSGGSLNTARGFGSAFGTQTYGIYATGYNGTANVANVENYNGTAWSEVADVNTARRETIGFGEGPAGLKIGGRPPQSALVESWNGSSWTEVGDLNTARSDGQSAWGTSTSGIVATAYNGSTAVANVESWNGSAWTETTDVNTARNYAFGLGTSSADGLVIGGNPNRAIVEQYDGSSWTETTDINTGRQHGSSSGTATLGIIFAGYTPTGMTETEFWNGSSWTEVSDLSTSRYGLGGSTNGTATAGLAFGGFPDGPGAYNVTEEFTADATVSTVTTS